VRAETHDNGRGGAPRPLFTAPVRSPLAKHAAGAGDALADGVRSKPRRSGVPRSGEVPRTGTRLATNECAAAGRATRAGAAREEAARDGRRVAARTSGSQQGDSDDEDSAFPGDG